MRDDLFIIRNRSVSHRQWLELASRAEREGQLTLAALYREWALEALVENTSIDPEALVRFIDTLERCPVPD